MGILIPNITNAKSLDKVKILTVEKIVKSERSEYLVKKCNDWQLTPKDVKVFFKTAKPFAHSMEINSFDILHCDIAGELLINGIKRNYRINLGGSAFLYGDDDYQQGFGCKKGTCLKYVYYEDSEEG